MEKSPVSILQELCTSKRVAYPVYVDLSTEFQDFCEYSVEAFGLIVDARGKNNKEAKQNAAKKMLEYIQKHDFLGGKCGIDSIRRFVDHIGGLITYCIRRKLPMPSFDYDSIPGSPGCLVKCRLGYLETCSKDASKKAAKHAAAKAMMEKLSDLSSSDLSNLQQSPSSLDSSELCFFKLEKDAVKAALNLLASKTSWDDQKVVEDVCNTLKIPYKLNTVLVGDQKKEVFEMTFNYAYMNVANQGNSCVQAKKYLETFLKDLSQDLSSSD
ncbi:hypothetical protein DMENIID0001_156830 [Sergentomyia squamirostris]